MMEDITEYEMDSDDYGDETMLEYDLDSDIDTEVAVNIDMGLSNSRKINLQNYTARLKIEQMQERIRLRKLLEEY